MAGLRRVVVALALVSGAVGVGGLAPAALGDGGCPNESLRQGLSATLPDCRAYELVSPAYKQGGRVEPLAFSSDGSRVIVQSFGNFGDAQNSPVVATYELTRGATGWSEVGIDPPAAGWPWNYFLDATPDLGKTLFYARAASQSVFGFDFWVRDLDGSMHDLGPVLPPAETVGPPELGEPRGKISSVRYRGASNDFLKILFTVSEGHWPGDTTATGYRSLYEYSAGVGGPPSLVGVDESGRLIGECGVDAGYAGTTERPAPGAVSADGSRVFFTVLGADESPCPLREPPVDELFARVNGSSTVAISEPSPNEQCTSASCVGAAPADAKFMAASADGSKVFFASTQQLTDGASEDSTPGDSATAGAGVGRGCPGTTGAGGCNLYEYYFQNPVGRRLVLVSAGDPNPQVQGVAAVSEDGSHAYFVAKGVLVKGENAYGARPVAGEDNLYVFERDAQFPGGRTSFIATLSPEDSYEWTASSGESLAADATPDGRFLVFASVEDLTPDDTSTVRQIFRYDAVTGTLVRVSIGQGGFNDNGNTDTLPPKVVESPFRGVERSLSPISDNGAYVVFTSELGLTPSALDAQPTDFPGVLARNVYEYHEGKVSLISDGLDATSVTGESSVSGMAGTVGLGGDAFFLTADPLVAQDGDTQQDLYDARIGGGFSSPTSLPGCEGDACQGPQATPPSLVGVGSAGFSGAGNLPPVARVPGKPASVKGKKIRRRKARVKRRRRRHAKAGRLGVLR